MLKIQPVLEKPHKRLLSIDLARALAIFLVTSFHLWRFYGSPHYIFGPFDLFAVFARGYVGVDLFFVISGYCIFKTWQRHARDHEGIKRVLAFYSSRLMRIYPAYIVALIFWVTLSSIGFMHNKHALPDIFSHIFFLHTLSESTYFSISGVLWSLAIEIHFYLLFPSLSELSSRVTFLLVIACAFIIASVGGILPFPTIYSHTVQSFVYKWNVLTFLPLFLLGMNLQKTKVISVGSKTMPLFKAGLIAAVLLMLFLKTSLFEKFDGHDFSLDIGERVLIGGMLGFLLLTFDPWSRLTEVVGNGFFLKSFENVVSICGRASFSIYLYNYVFEIFDKPLVKGIGGFVLHFFGIIIFGILAWQFIEKPCEKLRAKVASRREKIRDLKLA